MSRWEIMAGVGLGLLVVAAGMVSLPAGIAVAGLGLITIGVLGALDESQRISHE